LTFDIDWHVTPLLQLDVTLVLPFLFHQVQRMQPRSSFELWEIAHDRRRGAADAAAAVDRAR